MITMLAEMTPGQIGAAVGAGVAAGVVAGAGALKGLQYRRRNGNGKPGCTAACIEHLTRLGVLETDVKYIREDVKEIKGKLDEALKRR